MTDTPTPPMTPEQRAEFVAWLRRVRMRPTVADQLEADGVEIARLTGMLDDYYPAVDWWILQAKEAHEAQLKAEAALTAERDAAQAEIARLTAALATAREDGMREALAIIQDISLHDDVPGGMITPDTFDEGTNAAYEAVNDAVTKGAAT